MTLHNHLLQSTFTVKKPQPKEVCKLTQGYMTRRGKSQISLCEYSVLSTITKLIWWVNRKQWLPCGAPSMQPLGYIGWRKTSQTDVCRTPYRSLTGCSMAEFLHLFQGYSAYICFRYIRFPVGRWAALISCYKIMQAQSAAERKRKTTEAFSLMVQLANAV